MSLPSFDASNQAVLDGLLHVARQAGYILMQEFAKEDLAAKMKPDGSPVLRADKMCSEFLEQELPKIIEAPVLSEEGSWRDLAATRFFIVDPLDGTKEFMHGSRDFVINVALVENGRLVFGAVYAPAKSELYYAAIGRGAWKVNADNSPLFLHVSGRTKDRIGVASLSHLSAADTALLEQLDCHEVQRMGSALKFCAVAEGKADVYVRAGRTMLWDTAAPHLVVTEAGGRIYYQNDSGLQTGFRLQLENAGFICSNLPLNADFMRQWS